MARYTRGARRSRRGGMGKRRGFGKMKSRSRSRTGGTIRRTGKTFRRSARRLAASGKRYKKYYFTRMIDLEYKNIDPDVGPPQIQVTSYSSPLSAVGNMVTPAVVDSTAPCADGCTNFSASMIFKMNNLPNVSEFINTVAGNPVAGLFEDYKLKKVCIEITPTYGGKDIIAATDFTGIPGVDDGWTSQRSYPTPTLYYVNDYDSTNSINWPMICEMSGVQRLKLNKQHRIWINPAVIVPVANNPLGGTTWSTTRKSPWITNKDTTIQHYGMRFLVQDWPGPTDGVGPVEGDQISFGIRMNIRYFFMLRGGI